VSAARQTLSRCLLASAVAASTLAVPGVQAQPTPEGFLCCNMRTDGSWISDINYAESGKRVIPAGTPVKVTGYGRYRVYVEIGGKKQAIGNDYSRDLAMEAFMRRYVVADDPKLKLAGYPKPVQDAIGAARVMKGMTREQVTMAVGYPVSSENADLNARLWRLWIDSFAEFQLKFGDDGKVSEIVADAATRNRVVAE
jgi:hypothetical protein